MKRDGLDALLSQGFHDLDEMVKDYPRLKRIEEIGKLIVWIMNRECDDWRARQDGEADLDEALEALRAALQTK